MYVYKLGIQVPNFVELFRKFLYLLSFYCMFVLKVDFKDNLH